MKINKILTFIFIKTEGDNQEPKIKRNRQHLVHKTKTNKNEKKQHNNTCWIPLCSNKHN